MCESAIDIVVVDDNSVLVSVLSEVFRECGHSVRTASDGFLALAEIRKRIPDLLVSDLSMPGMSGNELLSIVRRRFPSVRVIAMSGAYSGGSIPPGVAADAFYAKGASGIDHLLQLVSWLWREDPRPDRSTVPVWVPQVSVDYLAPSVIVVSCPECLRPFSQQASTLRLLPGIRICPHCKMPIEVALVLQTEAIDKTPVSIRRFEPDKNQLPMALGHMAIFA